MHKFFPGGWAGKRERRGEERRGGEEADGKERNGTEWNGMEEERESVIGMRRAAIFASSSRASFRADDGLFACAFIYSYSAGACFSNFPPSSIHQS